MSSKSDHSRQKDNFVYRPPSNEDKGEQPSLEDLFGKLNIKIPKIPGFRRGSPFLIPLILIIIVLVWLASGVYTVSPDERGVLRTFGRYFATTEQGLRWHWPGPVGNTDIVAVTKTRRLELGFRGADVRTGMYQSVPAEANMITGDENIVQAEAVIQYRISDPKSYLFEVDDPGEVDRQVAVGQPDGKTLRDIAETALRQVVGSRNIDDILTTEKEAVQQAVLEKMRTINEDYKTGIDVQQVLLQNVNPPGEVQDAFEDVVKAREDRDRIINLAEAYEADQLPRARGESAKIIEAAKAFKEGRIAKATGEAAGFEEFLAGYLTSPEVTRSRLFLEAIDEIFPRVKKFIISGSAGVQPLLPLDDFLSKESNPQ